MSPMGIIPLNMVSPNAGNEKAKAIELNIRVGPQCRDHNGKAQEQDKRKFKV
jgi:hypothetical protein